MSTIFDFSFAEYFFNFYSLFSDKDNIPSVLNVPKILVEYFMHLYDRLDVDVEINIVDKIFPTIDIEKNKNILIGFSGGKDSVAVTKASLNLGYNPTLMYIEGINKSYSQEKQYIQSIAEYLKVPFVIKKFPFKLKSNWQDHPFKNQMILMLLLDYGIKNNITKYVFGNSTVDTVKTLNVNLEFSDGIEMTDSIKKFITSVFPNFELLTYAQDQLDSFKILAADKNLINLIHSCITPDFRRPMIRKANLKKYGEEIILPGRCGTCWKCALEYLVFQKLQILPYNEEYIKKCIKSYLSCQYHGSYSILNIKNDLEYDFVREM